MKYFKHKTDRSDQSHAILDAKSRQAKANKIVSVVSLFQNVHEANVLDIGTGSGHIASELSKQAKTVVSVDVNDERKIKDGYKFVQVRDETLPFDNETFDIVISNHIVEHVPNQKKHFEEIVRVLKPTGVIYLATPNKFWITDPHYKLPFISWLPRKTSAFYLRRIQGDEWDIYPLSHRGISKHVNRHQARATNALPLLVKTSANQSLDNWSSASKLMRLLPTSVLKSTQYFSPTLIYIVQK